MLVFIVRSVSFQVFVIVRILPGKEKKTAFPFGMLTKLLVVRIHMSEAAYCMEREAAFFDEKSTQFIDIRPVSAGGVPPVSVGHTAEVLVTKLSRIAWKLIGIYTEVRLYTQVP
jgi:hypothetical protein